MACTLIADHDADELGNGASARAGLVMGSGSKSRVRVLLLGFRSGSGLYLRVLVGFG